MLPIAITYKHILLKYAPIYEMGLQPNDINTLIIFNDLYLKKDKMLTVGETLKVLVRFSFVHNFRRCLSILEMLHAKGLISKRQLGKIKHNGKYKIKYMHTVKGKLFVNDLMIHFEAESLKLINA